MLPCRVRNKVKPVWIQATRGRSVCISALHVDVTRRVHRGSERRTGQPRRRRLRPAARVDHHSGWGVRPAVRAAGELFDEMNTYGAVLAGRRTAEQIDHWGGDRDGVPIFVVSHRPPGPSVADYPLVTYVTDGIASAMAQAKAAAGDRYVLVHGAYTAQRALEAGVLDELVIHQIPLLFGGGRRQFEVLSSRVELEIVRVIDTPEATHIHYRVRR